MGFLVSTDAVIIIHNEIVHMVIKYMDLLIVHLHVTIQGLACGANLWFGSFPCPLNPGRPEWSKVQTRGKPLVATAQAKYVSAGE